MMGEDKEIDLNLIPSTKHINADYLKKFIGRNISL